MMIPLNEQLELKILCGNLSILFIVDTALAYEAMHSLLSRPRVFGIYNEIPNV